MAVVFPHNQLKILDYNRVVKDLNGLTPEQFLAKIEEKFEVSSAGPKSPTTIPGCELRNVPAGEVVHVEGARRKLSG